METEIFETFDEGLFTRLMNYIERADERNKYHEKFLFKLKKEIIDYVKIEEPDLFKHWKNKSRKELQYAREEKGKACEELRKASENLSLASKNVDSCDRIVINHENNFSLFQINIEL